MRQPALGPVVRQPSLPATPAVLGPRSWCFGLLQLPRRPGETAADLINRYLSLIEHMIDFLSINMCSIKDIY